MKGLLLGTMMLAAGLAQQCDIPDSQKTDCGYVGIDQSGC